ncbi:MAG: cell division protein [Rhodospirillaceae bacterium]|nr:cell division protein [Rhodospirillaceae bacterium]
MLRRRSDLPFDHDTTTAFLPAMIAMMVFLATLALSGALVLDNLLSRWNRDIKGTLTVQIIPEDSDPRAKRATQRIEKTIRILEETPGVIRARALLPQELAALIEPWLGSTDLIADLPLPQLIDVTISETQPPNLTALSARLKKAVPGASVDDHRIWLARVISLADGLEMLAKAVMTLVTLAAAAAVIFATRAGLAIHRQSIEILHLVGARDGYIGRQYALRALWLGGQGAIIGFGLAIPVLLGLGTMAKTLEGGLLAEIGFSSAHWMILATVPMTAALLAMAAAFLTVLKTLSRML